MAVALQSSCTLGSLHRGQGDRKGCSRAGPARQGPWGTEAVTGQLVLVPTAWLPSPPTPGPMK